MLSPGREARRGGMVARNLESGLVIEVKDEGGGHHERSVRLTEAEARWLMVAALPELLEGADR
jgi:hypothetical protein